MTNGKMETDASKAAPCDGGRRPVPGWAGGLCARWLTNAKAAYEGGDYASAAGSIGIASYWLAEPRVDPVKELKTARMALRYGDYGAAALAFVNLQRVFDEAAPPKGTRRTRAARKRRRA